MQKGLDIVELAQEIKRIEAAKKDLVAPTTRVRMTHPVKPEDLRIEVDASNGKVWSSKGVVGHSYEIGPVAHEQISDRLGIPRRYYNRMLQEAPTLLAANCNTWFQRNPERRMLRTLDGRLRAFLSDKYRPLDNYLIAQAALPVLVGQEDIKIISTQLTEKRLYIQAITPRIQGEVRVGDVVQAGIVISNSEVGCGAVLVEPLIYRLACLNGMIRSVSLRRHHVGKRISSDEISFEEFYSTETIQADNQAFLLKVRDTVAHAFDEEAFRLDLVKLQEAAEEKIKPSQAEDVVVEITKRFSLTQAEGDDILDRLIQDGDFTKYGVANAITNVANDVEGYDRVIELERIGGQVIDLPKKDWRVLVEAA